MIFLFEKLWNCANFVKKNNLNDDSNIELNKFILNVLKIETNKTISKKTARDKKRFDEKNNLEQNDNVEENDNDKKNNVEKKWRWKKW